MKFGGKWKMMQRCSHFDEVECDMSIVVIADNERQNEMDDGKLAHQVAKQR